MSRNHASKEPRSVISIASVTGIIFSESKVNEIADYIHDTQCYGGKIGRVVVPVMVRVDGARS